jgi:hypothetical protein
MVRSVLFPLAGAQTGELQDIDALFKAGNDDLVLRRRVGEVLNMLKLPLAFFEPAIIARVALWALRRKFTGTGTAAHPIPAMPPALIPVG